MTLGRTALATAIGYLAGSIPSADIATRLSGADVDLRSAGTGNPGATNAASILGPGWGAAVLAADMAKGTLGAMAGRAVGGDAGAYAAATSAIAGHIAPVWSGFRGGKGVATSAGACLAVFPVYAPVDAAVATIGALRSRRAEEATRLACAVWVAAAIVAWRARLSNAWGPTPGPGLPLFAAASSAMILAKFAASRRRTA
jgi:glycerol-3-phosphate acyltransferase PlsY